MNDLQELQHKRIVMLSATALVFSGYAIWTLSSNLFADGRLVDTEQARGSIYLMSSAIIMTMAVVYVMMRSFIDNQQIHHQTHHDLTTGLLNSDAWRHCVTREIAANASKTGVWLCMIDVARMRAINDSFGTDAGDAVIKEMAARLSKLRTPGVDIFRLRGDVFGIRAHGPEESSQFRSLMDRVHEYSQMPLQYEGKSIFLDVYAGAAFIEDSNLGFQEAIHRVETALMESKCAKSPRIVIYDEHTRRSQREQNALLHDLREELESGNLEPDFQPLVGSDGRTVIGFEALARWYHADHGYISPARFIPMAEQLGLVELLGEVMLTKACQQIRPIARMTVSVNISPEHFLSPDFVKRVGEILDETGMPADRLEIEITENVLISDAEAAISTMRSLREIGVTIALDDFGTGYCGLSYLNRFEVDRIKIDQSFVKEIAKSVSSRSMITTIVDLAAEHGFGVIVEGVETEEQFSFLRQFNGLWYQGYYFARPLQLSDLLETSRNGSFDLEGFEQELGASAPGSIDARSA